MLYRRLMIEWTLVSISATLMVVAATQSRMAAPIDNLLFDTMTRLRSQPADERILIAEIDDASLAEIGPWPWPRSVYARALEQLAKNRPAAIGMDILFIEPTADDAMLAAAMRGGAPVILPMLPKRGQGDDDERRPPPVISTAAAGLGAVDISIDGDGVVRHLAPAATSQVPHMAELIARQVDPAIGPVPRRSSRLIAFTAPGAFRTIPFTSLLNGGVPPSFLSGKIIFIGGTAAGFGDRFLVPPSAGHLISGVALQANILNAILHDAFYRTLATPVQMLLALLPVWLLLLAFLRFAPSTNLRLSIIAIAAVLSLSLGLLLVGGRWFAPGPTLIGLILVYSLWGWRRLASVSDYLAQEVRQLQTEPDVIPVSQRPRVRGDRVNIETNRLHDVIGQIRDLRSFIADVLARLPDAVCVLSNDGKVVLGNRAAEALFGGPVRDCAMSALLAGLHVDGVTPDAEILLRDGRTLVMTQAPIGSDGMIMRFVDISELKAAANSREEALQFLSHDMRAPYAAVIALLDRQDGAEPDRLTGMIRQHAGHGLKLADDFVQLARLQNRAPVLEPVDLQGVLSEAADMIWPLSSRKPVTIDQDAADTEIWVTADQASLLRALLNLLDNAVKFADPGGLVSCRIAQDAVHATIFISGPGPDMPAGRRGDPFQAYAPGASAEGVASRGLGLAFVRTAIERQHGSVGYEARANGIKVFSVTLPLAEAD